MIHLLPGIGIILFGILIGGAGVVSAGVGIGIPMIPLGIYILCRGARILKHQKCKEILVDSEPTLEPFEKTKVGKTGLAILLVLIGIGTSTFLVGLPIIFAGMWLLYSAWKTDVRKMPMDRTVRLAQSKREKGMEKILYSTISTTQFSKAYIVKTWGARGELSDYERKGFAQFFYLTLSGHVEAVLVELIERRMMYIRTLVRKLEKEFCETVDKTTQKIKDSQILYNSLKGIMTSFSEEYEKAPLNKLIDLFQKLFLVKLSKEFGDLHNDLLALADLRNIFAHGRAIFLSFHTNEENNIDLTNNPLVNPAKRLQAAKILKNLEFNGYTHHEFTDSFYSDEALLYFYGRARELEKKFKDFLIDPLEKEMGLMIELPELSL